MAREDLLMEMMPYRYETVRQAIAGFEKSGIPLVAWDGSSFKPSGFADDIGLSLIIPRLVTHLGFTQDGAIDILFVSIIIISLLLGIVGSLLYFRSWIGRIIALVGLLALSAITFMVGGIYITASATLMGIVPLFLYFAERRVFGVPIAVFLFLSGFGIGAANLIRVHTATGVLIFVLGGLFIYLKSDVKRKVALIALTIVGFILPLLFSQIILERRDAFLRENAPGYREVVRNHAFWHSVYIGFGFLENQFGIRYKDEIAYAKVDSIKSGVPRYSLEYNKIVRKMVFDLVKEHPYFTFFTVTAKMGVLLAFFLVFANIGLLASYFHPKPLALDLLFAFAICFNILPGIMVMPYQEYLLGFFAFSMLYGVVSINYALDNGALNDIAELRTRFLNKLKSHDG